MNRSVQQGIIEKTRRSALYSTDRLVEIIPYRYNPVVDLYNIPRFCLVVKRLYAHFTETVKSGAKDAVDISAAERYNEAEGKSCK